MSATATPLPSSNEVLDLIAATLELDRSLLMPDLAIEQIGVDSLDLLRLTHAIEKKYRVDLSRYSYADINSVERLLELLQVEIQARHGR